MLWYYKNNSKNNTTSTSTKQYSRLHLYEEAQKLLHLCEIEATAEIIIEIIAENIKVTVDDRR